MGNVVAFRAKAKKYESTFTPQTGRGGGLARGLGKVKVDIDGYGVNEAEEFVLFGSTHLEEMFVANCDTMMILDTMEHCLASIRDCEMDEWECKRVKGRLDQLSIKLQDVQIAKTRW